MRTQSGLKAEATIHLCRRQAAPSLVRIPFPSAGTNARCATSSRTRAVPAYVATAKSLS
ncbi:hypothetical protein DHODJN_20985 [Methylorubrum extorquens]